MWQGRDVYCNYTCTTFGPETDLVILLVALLRGEILVAVALVPSGGAAPFLGW